MALHHKFFAAQMKKVVDDTMIDNTLFDDTIFDDTMFDDTMFNNTMFDNASLLFDSIPHNVKLHKPILLNKQGCILADSHSQALYLVEFAQNEKKCFFFHLKQDALNF